MQGGKNWILPKYINANRFFWNSHWLEIWSNHFCPSMGLNGGSVATDSEINCFCIRTSYGSCFRGIKSCLQQQHLISYNCYFSAAAAVIQGEKAVFVKPGSSISLSCTIALYSVPPATIAWYRDGRHLNLGSARGGVSLENEKTPQYTRSTLLVRENL